MLENSRLIHFQRFRHGKLPFPQLTHIIIIAAFCEHCTIGNKWTMHKRCKKKCKSVLIKSSTTKLFTSIDTTIVTCILLKNYLICLVLHTCIKYQSQLPLSAPVKPVHPFLHQEKLHERHLQHPQQLEDRHLSVITNTPFAHYGTVINNTLINNIWNFNLKMPIEFY